VSDLRVVLIMILGLFLLKDSRFCGYINWCWCIDGKKGNDTV